MIFVAPPEGAARALLEEGSNAKWYHVDDQQGCKVLYEVYHELQVATGPSMPRESDSPSPVAEESLPAASEEVCADLRAAAAPPMDK